MKIRSALLLLMISGLLMASVVLPSCTKKKAGPADDVLVNAVRYYNSMLIRCYMEANLNLMQGVATEDQMSKLFPVIQGLRAEDSLMRANQNSFAVGKVSTGEDTASVETVETWEYWWERRGTGRITKPKTSITYTMRYHLVREDKAWKVNELETID